MSATPDPKVIITSAISLVESVIATNPVQAFLSAKALLEEGLLLLPPVDAPELDPADRAAVDAEIAAEIKKP